MALDDAIGSGPDFTADSVLDRVQRSVLPDLPQYANADMVLNRLNRKLSMPKAPDESAAPEEPEKKASGGKPDFSSQGTPIGDLPDLSAFGTPADEVVPLPEPRPAGAPPPPSLGVTGNAAAFAKGIPAGAAQSAGGILAGAGRMGETSPYNVPGFAMGPTEPQINPAEVPKALTPEQNPVLAAGQAVQNLAPTMTDAEKQSVGGRLGTMVGGIAPYAAATLAGGPEIGMAAGFTGMAADTYGNVYDDAKKKGADDATAASAAGKSALVAGVLGSLPLGAGKYAQGLVAKAASSSAAFATAGEAQEWLLQEIAKDYDPKAGYSLDQRRLIAELILGAGMGGLHHAFVDGAAADQQEPTADAQSGPQARAPDEGIPPPPPDFTDIGADEPQTGPAPGTGSWQRRQPPPGGAGPKPGPEAEPPPDGSGPQPSPDTGGPGAGNAGTASDEGPQEAPKPGGPPPGTGEGKGDDFVMDAHTRAKMERVMRTIDPTVDVSKMSDAVLFNTLNDRLRDTSSTGYTAKPETPEEATARQDAATARTEREGLIRKGGGVLPGSTP